MYLQKYNSFFLTKEQATKFLSYERQQSKSFFLTEDNRSNNQIPHDVFRK